MKLDGGAVHQLNFPFSPELEALTDSTNADAAAGVPTTVLRALQDSSQRAAASQTAQVSRREAAQCSATEEGRGTQHEQQIPSLVAFCPHDGPCYPQNVQFETMCICVTKGTLHHATGTWCWAGRPGRAIRAADLRPGV